MVLKEGKLLLFIVKAQVYLHTVHKQIYSISVVLKFCEVGMGGAIQEKKCLKRLLKGLILSVPLRNTGLGQSVRKTEDQLTVINILAECSATTHSFIDQIGKASGGIVTTLGKSSILQTGLTQGELGLPPRQPAPYPRGVQEEAKGGFSFEKSQDWYENVC